MLPSNQHAEGKAVMSYFKHRQALAWSVLFVALWFATTLTAKEKKPDDNLPSPPRLSPGGGIFTKNFAVELSSATAGAVIHYTVDGAEPDETAPTYSKPLSIEANTLVRARAYASGKPSPTAAETYTVLDSDLAAFNSNLPLVLLNSFGTNIAHEYNIPGSIQVIDGGKERTRINAAPSLGSQCWLHIRGRASLRYPKHSYTVKLTNPEGDSGSQQVLGMPAESDWVLYAPYPDKTLIRDVVAYELYGKMGYWSPRCRFVEVFVNTNGRKLSRRDYVGVYVLEEKIKRDENRVNIAKLKPGDISEPEITGGYIFKKDHIGNIGYGVVGDPLGGFPGNGTPSSSSKAGYPTGPGGFPADPKGFVRSARTASRSSSSSSTSSSSSSSSSSRSSRSTRVVTNYFGRPPQTEMASMSQSSFSREDEEENFMNTEGNIRTSHTNEFFFVEPDPLEITAVQKAWLKNYLNKLEGALYGPDFADPAKGYAAFLDPGTFIDYHIMVEATKNVDGFRFSDFFYKNRGGKIRNAPIWDWNLSFGNANGKQGWLAENWMWPQLDNKEYTWYRRLFDDPDFGQRYVDRWADLRTNVLATVNVLGRIDEMATLLQESQKRNFEKWPILGRNVNPNYFVGSSFDEEINYMKKFIQTRLEWITKQFPEVPRVSSRGGGQNVELASGSDGQIYFTTDGTDPRASGGNPSPTAKAYSGAVPLGAGSKLMARLRQENRWSSPLAYQASQ
ncbi:MAG: hypothetical protein JWM16_1021 [Verrucomicrobiales bacterium]|nr:hypothetical protein [Verrucomicrobiales bacterium]